MKFDNNPVKYNRAEVLTRFFEDTQDWYRSDPALEKSIAASIAGTVLYPAGVIPNAPSPRFSQPMSVAVSRRRTLEAALLHLQRDPGANVTVLNFASATNPGVGATRGSSAQEESLCRCSTRYPTLCTPRLRREFYQFHRNLRDMGYTDACIYTPGVTISDILPPSMPKHRGGGFLLNSRNRLGRRNQIPFGCHVPRCRKESSSLWTTSTPTKRHPYTKSILPKKHVGS